MLTECTERCIGLVFAIVDWRALVIISLVVYSNVQASTQPFKLPHESTLDNTSVQLLVLLYAAHIGRDHVEAIVVANADVFLIVVLIVSTLILLLLTVRGRYITRRLVRWVRACLRATGVKEMSRRHPVTRPYTGLIMIMIRMMPPAAI